MQQKYTFEQLSEKMSTFNLSLYQANICQNIKKIRKELYNQNKPYYKSHDLKNPYSSQSVAELLDISHEYYKRLESFDKSKPISLKLFLKIVFLFEKEVQDFFE